MCKCVKDSFDSFINYNVYVVYFSVLGHCGISQVQTSPGVAPRTHCWRYQYMSEKHLDNYVWYSNIFKLYIHNTYQDVFSWLKNRDPNETHVYSLKKKYFCFFVSWFLDFCLNRSKIPLWSPWSSKDCFRGIGTTSPEIQAHRGWGQRKGGIIKSSSIRKNRQGNVK